ncbi:hypothetical protein P5V15_011185 [Pogonomyrmex californicus]
MFNIRWDQDTTTGKYSYSLYLRLNARCDVYNGIRLVPKKTFEEKCASLVSCLDIFNLNHLEQAAILPSLPASHEYEKRK